MTRRGRVVGWPHLDPRQALRRFVLVPILCAAAAAALLRADSALPRGAEPLVATPRLYVGFLDDMAFRWRADRGRNLDRASRGGASVIRTIVDWRFAAPRRPADPTDPFAREYRLGDVDELVRNAHERGMEVLLTIWGTPGWANGGRRKNVAPLDPDDLRDFAQALASRYSGRYPGYPFVRFYTIWNEPNAEQFLAPQFDARGRSLAPRTYAALVAAAYAGIKRGSPGAVVGAGETAARGADRRKRNVQDSHSPARFARLVAAAAPELPFDAWAHHPYPPTDRTNPAAQQRWPAVGLTSLGRFEASLARWFARDEVPLWVTEIGYRTSPEVGSGAPYPLQARYLARAVELARSSPGVRMLVWFIFRDEPGEPWQSGLVDQLGRPKPSLARFVGAATAADAATLEVEPTDDEVLLRVPALELRSRLPARSRLSVSYLLFSCDRFAAAGTEEARLGTDGWVSISTSLPLEPRRTYRLVLAIDSAAAGGVRREVTLHGPGAGTERGSGCNRPVRGGRR